MALILSKLYFILFAFISFLLLTNLVSADGMIHVYDPDMQWGLFPEEQQLCAINYENGIQKMILTVGFREMEGERAVWVFPIPSEPDDTSIDIIKGFPQLLGYDVMDRIDESISNSFMLIRASQIYTLAEMLFSLNMGFRGIIPAGKGWEHNIEIHEHIEEMGLTTELVTAEDGSSLFNYLISKGFDAPLESKAILEDYVDGYTFVVSWISDIEKFNNESTSSYYYGMPMDIIGVSIEFPIDKIYFPLKPTSVYGNRKIPVVIYVLGHVTPELYPSIQEETELSYFNSFIYEIPTELTSFFNNREVIKDFPYTKIKIETESDNFIEDLWINDVAPPEIQRANFIYNNFLVWYYVIFIICSCLAAFISGAIVYRKDQPALVKFILFGFLNFITLIGFAFIAYGMDIGNRFTRLNHSKRKNKDSSKPIKLALIVAILVAGIFVLPPMSYVMYAVNLLILLIPLAMVFAFVFIFSLPFAFLYYRDKKLGKFVVFFSILFVILSIVSQFIIHYLF